MRQIVTVIMEQIDPKTKIALQRTRSAFNQFSRNGRWGTCADCPRDSENNAYPEFCKNTKRYDHLLNMKALAESWEIASNPIEF